MVSAVDTMDLPCLSLPLTVIHELRVLETTFGIMPVLVVPQILIARELLRGWQKKGHVLRC